MYNLANEAVRELSRCGLFRREKQYREPLDGVPDGSNTVFRTQFRPLVEADGVTVYLSGGSLSSGSYTVDYETGTIVFDTAPAVASQPQASYYWANITTRELTQIAMDGFDTMEVVWARGWSLSSGSAAYGVPTEDSTAIYVVSGYGGVADPTCGGTTFSKSRTQVAVYQSCCRLAYLNARLISSAEDDIDYREDRGMAATRSRRTPNLERAFNAEWQKLMRYLEQARQEYYIGSESDLYGAYYSMPATEDYLANLEWQYYSKLQDLRATYKYRGT